jgi:hypothetical protein
MEGEGVSEADFQAAMMAHHSDPRLQQAMRLMQVISNE